MRQFAGSAKISAHPEAVWALLTDAAGYPLWNSTVEKIDGRIAAGERLTLYVTATPGRAFPLQVAAFAPPRSMTWTGGMPLGLFTGTRRFVLTPSEDGVEFSMSETYRGPLAPLISRVLPDLQPAFDRFAADLKHRAEA